ncbi:MAG TPA: amidohydrolase/deacetylase family metallohydrolase [Vicinamibacterales bacterium]|nr:amidohydrolase/deacetylase family metallohydrolase [Vicinamibacterales bacterium]
MSRSSRRAFLGTLGSAAVALPQLSGHTIRFGADLAAAAPAVGQAAASYDLLIKGGRVIDPSRKLSGPMDVAIANGKIAAVAANIPAGQARNVFDARGKLVTPGLINVHAHLYIYGNTVTVDPEPVGFPAGVTTAIDAGSAGANTFLGFRKFVIDTSPLRIYAMLNIAIIGNYGNELYLNMSLINARSAIRLINEQRDRIVAVKVRINGIHDELATDVEVLKRAREAADATGLPIMMHWSNEPDLLAMLKPGDILTHPFPTATPRMPNLFGGQPGKVLPQILELKSRGILTDAQAGTSHHSWDVSEKAFSQGWIPDLISTDIGSKTPQTPNGQLLPWVMTQFLYLGLTVEQIIERVTVTPTKVFKFSEKVGTLEPGVTADVTVIDLQEGNFELVDQQGTKRMAKQKFVPVATVHGGTLTKIDPKVHEVAQAGLRV